MRRFQIQLIQRCDEVGEDRHLDAPQDKSDIAAERADADLGCSPISDDSYALLSHAHSQAPR